METLNIEEAAEMLKIHPVTLSEKANLGDIPGARVGKRWVFVKVDLIDYIRSQYKRQAMQGEPMEVSICHSTKKRLHFLVGQDHAFQRTMRTTKHWDCRQSEGAGIP